MENLDLSEIRQKVAVIKSDINDLLITFRKADKAGIERQNAFLAGIFIGEMYRATEDLQRLLGTLHD